MDFFDLSASEYYETDRQLGWRPRKNVHGTHAQAGSFTYAFSTNSRGLRDREYSEMTAPEGQRRIVVLGDSFAWGWGVENQEIFTERVESILADTDVINLGVTGYGLRQEIDYLKREGLSYQPDIVVLAFCLNDIFRPQRVAKAADGHTHPAGKSRAPASFLLDAKQALYQRSSLYRVVINGVNTNKVLVRWLVALGIKGSLAGFEDLDINLMPALNQYPSQLDDSWAITKAEILELKKVTRDASSRLVIAMIPSVQSIEPKTFEHAIAYSEFDANDFDLGKPYRIFAEFANANQIELVNPFDRFREARAGKQSLYLRYDMHFNSAGHELFAQALAEYLE